jgi:hypothetical protein
LTHADINPTVAIAAPSTSYKTVFDDADAETRRGHIGAWTRSALRDVGYCAAICAWSVGSFAILVTGAAVTASLLFLAVGFLIWICFVHLLRWTTLVDRRLAGWQRRERVKAAYRRPTERGLIPYLRTLSADPQTWRDMAWVAANSFVGFALGYAVITAAGLALTYVSMPVWYWAIAHPGQHCGLTNLGFLTVTTLGKAGITAAIGVGLIPCVLLLARGCAALHAGLAVRLLNGAG